MSALRTVLTCAVLLASVAHAASENSQYDERVCDTLDWEGQSFIPATEAGPIVLPAQSALPAPQLPVGIAAHVVPARERKPIVRYTSADFHAFDDVQVTDVPIPRPPRPRATLWTDPASDAAVRYGESVPSLATPDLGRSFDTADYDNNAAVTGGSRTIPADPHGAAGPAHVVNVVNVAIQFWTKNGANDLNSALFNFFAPLSPATLTFDPKVVYDQHAGRFVVVTLERTTSPQQSFILIAVSDDDDPNGTWFYTKIDSKLNIGGIDRWADYPGLAVDDEAIYVTNNMFSFAGSYGGSRVWIISKGLIAGLYAGGAASFSVHDPYAGGGLATTTQPTHTFGATPGGVGTWLMSYSGINSGGDDLWQWVAIQDPVGSPTFVQGFVDAGNVDAGGLPSAPQAGISDDVSTNDRRAHNAVWRDGSLYATATINPTASFDAANTGQATAWWVRLSTAAPTNLTLADQGTAGGNDLDTNPVHTFFPSVAVNAAGSMLVGFSASSSGLFPGSYYASRDAGDPPGTIGTTRTVRPGQAPYLRTFCGGSNRWGDYSGTSVDPATQCFWIYNKHAQTQGGTSFCGGTAEDGRWGTAFGEACTTTTVCGDGTIEGDEECDDGNVDGGDGCDENCLDEVCGNGVLQSGEACDDGNAVDEDGCDSSCVVEFCGDDVVQAGLGEQCDDGNAINGDGCDDNCRNEICGNGILQSGEGCDDGNTVAEDGCDENCAVEFCGDGVVQAGLGEDCDDGGNVNGDGCDANCIDEVCGNGVVQDGEACDDGNGVDDDACANDCTANVDPNILINGDFAAGTPPWVFFTNGAGSFQVVGGEARLSFTADGSNVQLYQNGVAADSNTVHTISFRARHTLANRKIVVRFGNHVSPFQSYGISQTVVLSTAMQSYSFDFTTTADAITNGRVMFLVSNADAVGSNIFIDDVVLKVTSPDLCGNGAIDAGETCDGGNLDGQTCALEGFDGGTLACNAACDGLDTSACYVCGDNVADGPETCDGTDLDGMGCADLGFNAGTLGCTAACDGFDTSMCTICGDGDVDAGEECDDGNLANGDGCDSNCIGEVCGNGIVQAGEECDDGNLIDDDGCSNACTINAITNLVVNGDFSAGTAPWTFYTNGSGSFQVAGGEARLSFTADGSNVQLYQRNIAADGNTDYTVTFRARHSLAGKRITVRFAKHAAPYTFYGLSQRVTLTTSMQTYSIDFATTSGPITDGRLMFLVSDADTPGSTMHVDDVVLAPSGPTTCGNGALDAGEACDGGNLAGESCVSQGFDGGTLACNATCSGFVTSGCFGCGDGVVNGGEVCDGSDLDGQTCASQGFDAGDLGCSAGCDSFVTADCSTCGDGIVGSGEQCDDGNTAGGDGCSATCQTEGGSGSNLVSNGSFNSGTSGWFFATNASSSFSVVGGQAVIDVDTPGSSVQLYQPGIALQPSTTYRLTFRGRNTGGDNVRMRVIRHSSPYTNYGLNRVIDLTTAMQTFSMTFTTPSGPLAAARLQFWIAPYDSAGDDYFFDDVVLEAL